MKPILLAPLAVLALAGTGAWLWVTAEGPVEEAPIAEETLGTPTPAVPDERPPSLLSQPSPEPVPPEWVSYTDPGTGVTLRHPPGWVAERRELSTSYGGLYQVSISKPVPNPVVPQDLPAEPEHLPLSASVSLFDCCLPGFLEFWACDRPREEVMVGGYPADRCVYSQEQPPPAGFQFPEVGASILYTVHTPEGDLYLNIGLFTWDETGTVLLDSWSAEDQGTAEQIVHTLQIASPQTS